MAAMLDSEAVFQSRLRDLGLPDSDFVKLKANNVNSLGRFAYITTIQPGVAADDSPFVEALLKALNLRTEADLDMGSLAAYRRLWVESYTVSISEIRNRIEKTDDTAPRRLPQPERNSRRNAQQLKFPGLKIIGNLEPANCLVDFVCAMREENVLQYVDPAKSVSRDQELGGVRVEKFLKTDPVSGIVREVSRAVDLYADLSSEFRVRNALLRRSLALDQIDLLPFNDGEEYHNFLFQLLSTEPMATHYHISMEQILNADKLVWRKMAELTRDGIVPTTIVVGLLPVKTYPIKQALDRAIVDPIVSSALQPLPKPASSARAGPYEHAAQKQKAHQKGEGKGKGKAKAGGKGGGKGSKEPRPLPAELQGLRLATRNGSRYCWSSNLTAGCQHARFGASCKSGFHGCMKCGASDHGASTCTKQPAV